MVSKYGRLARLTVLGAISMVFSVGACGGPDVERPSSEGPFIGTDPDDLVESVSWVDPLGEIGPIRIGDPGEWPGAVLLDTSGPRSLMVAVAGTTCVPGVVVSLRGPAERVAVTLELSEPVPDPGTECGDMLRTHAFELKLVEPINLDEVTLSVNVQP